MTSLIGNVDAFTSFSFGTPSAPAPVNTGQTFTNNNPTNTPTFVNTNPQAGIDQETLNRIAFKDEENTFTKEQKIGIYEVGKTLDIHQDDIQDNKEKLVRIENTTDGVVVSSKVRASGFEIDESGSITDVKTTLTELSTRITNNKSTADTNKTSIENNKTVADTRHTQLSTLITNNKSTADANFQTNKTSIENNKKVADTRNTELTSKISTLESTSTTHGTDITNLKSRTTTIESSLGSTRTDAELNTFIGNHPKLNNIVVDGSQLNLNSDFQLASGKVIKYNDSGTVKDFQTEINNNTNAINANTNKIQGFSRDIPNQKTKFTDKLLLDLVRHRTYTDSRGFQSFLPESGPRETNVQTDQDVGVLLAHALTMQDYLFTLAIMSNFRPNGVNPRAGTLGHECLFGTPFGVLNNLRSVTTVRILGEEIYLGRVVNEKITEAGQENNPENTEIALRATLTDLISSKDQFNTFRDNINTTIDARLTTVTTSATNETISSLINASLSSSGLLNTDYRLSILSTDIFEIMGEIVGSSVMPTHQNKPVRGYFANEYHPSNPTWGLFIFGLIDRPVGTLGATLKMAGKYFDIADPTIPFKENHPEGRWSTEFKFPTEWILGPDRKDGPFVVKSWKSAGGTSRKVAKNPNNMNAFMEVTSGHLTLPISSSSTEYGWGVINVSTSTTGLNNVYTSLEQFNTLDDQINNTTTGVLGKVSTLETSINDTYNKSASDSRYPSKDQFNILNNTVSTNTSNISSINTRVGSNESKLNTAETNITNINTAIGDDNTSGTLKGRIKVNEDSITTIQNDGFLQTPNDNSGKSLKCDNVNVLRGSTYLPVLTSDDFRQLLINNVDVVSGQVQQNTVLIAGPNLVIPRSPNPIVFVDSDGRLGSSSLSESRYDDQVFGADNRGEDGNATDNNLQKFQHGLVPSFVSTVSGGKKGGTVRVGSSIHILTAQGTWRKLSDMFVENGVSTVSVSENLPDFQPITKNNQFALCSQVNGGTIFYADVDTSFISEHASRLYHTPERVNNLINTKIGDGSIANAVINHIESQTLTAVSDRRLKTNIKKINKNIEKLEPVQFEYKNDKGQIRYGLIAQNVKINYPELVETDVDGKMSIKYLDIIGMLIKDNQDLRNKINEIEKLLKKK